MPDVRVSVLAIVPLLILVGLIALAVYLIVALIRYLNSGASKNARASEARRQEREVLEKMEHTAQRMDERIENLETILSRPRRESAPGAES